MASDEAKTATSADVTSSDSSHPVPSASLSLEEKDASKIDSTGVSDATDVQKTEYPEGWRLWIVYIATLLTMFLVGFPFYLELKKTLIVMLKLLNLGTTGYGMSHLTSPCPVPLAWGDLLTDLFRPSSRLRSQKSRKNSRVSTVSAGMGQPSS
jgi:hypothetical protein